VQELERWRVAQEYEQDHWRKLASRILDGRADLRWYRWKAERTLSRLGACRAILPADAVIAEVGSGPVGQAGFLPGSRHIAVDPLSEYFEQHESLLRERPSNVEYLAGRGEELPLPDSSCDLVVIDNCLDHCESPNRVLAEIRRVLRPGAYLYLTLNVRSAIGRRVREIAETLVQVDKGHPHSYHTALLKATIAREGFAELDAWLQPWSRSIAEAWQDGRLRSSVKFATLTIERLYEGVWRATPGDGI
jgi:SAM-dependent methyltransferase